MKLIFSFSTELDFTFAALPMKILIIEDEKSLLDSIVEYLSNEGFVCETAADFFSAEEKIQVYQYDCIVADITLPGGSGLTLIKDFKKENSETGVIIISAKNSLDDKIIGLELGADDYLTKPFHLSELNARIKSLIRRRNFKGENEIVAGEIKIIPEKLEVLIKEEQISLTRKEYDLLLFFIANKNRVLTKEAIAEHLWGEQSDAMDSFDFIYTHLKNLRKKIIDAGGEDYVKTIYGIGYKFMIA
ncbi:MAG: response regulator transcription factor [Chitinophagales bacterium]|nr:response regulator transcription factor [Chitinophagales bacterium]